MPDHLPEGVVSNDAKSFEDKLGRLRSAGSSKLHVVADFDMTLTAGSSNDPDIRNSSWGALQSIMLHPEWFVKEYKELYEAYNPVIHDGSLNATERDRLLHEWYAKTLELVLRRKLTRKDIELSARSGIIEPRKRLKEFFDTARRHSIPVVVFSAGLGDFIEAYLKFHDAYSDNVHIVSNFYTFDGDGFVVAQANHTVHSANKNEAHADYDVQKIAHGRTNVLLLGDFEFDIHMADGEHHDTILSIGLLNGKQEHLPRFKKTFDAVVLEDEGLDFPINILNGIETTTAR